MPGCKSLAALRRQTGASIQILPAMAEEEMRLNRRVDALADMGDDSARTTRRPAWRRRSRPATSTSWTWRRCRTDAGAQRLGR